jgi:hypothetical protein
VLLLQGLLVDSVLDVVAVLPPVAPVLCPVQPGGWGVGKVPLLPVGVEGVDGVVDPLTQPVQEVVALMERGANKYSYK